MYRKFWLENKNGDIWHFANQGDTFGHSPTGLGLSSNYSFIRLGDSEMTTFFQYNLLDIGLKIIFLGDTNSDIYQKYFNFIQFISQEPLLFHYQTPNLINESYFRNVILVGLEKSEILPETRTLDCQLQLKPTTLWRSSKEEVVEINSGYEDGKSYPLNRPYHYIGNNVERIKLFNKSTQYLSLIIEVFGVALNPTFRLFDNKGELYGIGRFIGQYEYVYVNSFDSEEEIKLYDGAAYLPNPASYQDLEVGIPNKVFVTFLKIKPGENTLRFLFDNVFDGYIVVRWRNEYASI